MKHKKPFLIALDSSDINNIAKDYFHENPKKKKKALKVINSIYEKGGAIVITWHHIEEIIAHMDDDKVIKSIELIRELPLVAYINGEEFGFTGNIVSIHTKEVISVLEGTDNLEKIVNSTSNDLFGYSSGRELIEPLLSVFEVLRNRSIQNNARKKEIASISRTNISKRYNLKLSDFEKGELNSLEDVNKMYEYLKITMSNDIKNHGDKMLDSAEDIAEEFYKELSDEASINLQKYQASSYKEVTLKENNITEEEYNQLRTFDDLSELAIFKERMKVMAEHFPEDKKNEIMSIHWNKSPIWLLWRELFKIRNKTDRVTGSDITDAYLAILSLYIDLTFVDKRTREYLDQIKRRDKKLKPLIKRYEKLSDYTDILKYLN